MTKGVRCPIHMALFHETSEFLGSGLIVMLGTAFSHRICVAFTMQRSTYCYLVKNVFWRLTNGMYVHVSSVQWTENSQRPTTRSCSCPRPGARPLPPILLCTRASPPTSRLLDESGEDVRPFIERNRFQPRASSCLRPKEEEQHAGVASPPPARLSFLQAVELVLTTGPLSRERRDDGRGGAPVALVADASGEASPPGDRVAPPTAGRGSPTFEGFGDNVEASVVASVLELLRRATAAAERLGLSPRERERLAMWSGAAAATAS